MASPNLKYTELANSQTNQYVTANEAMRVLEQAICGRLTINFSSDANYTLETATGSEEWRDKFMTLTDTGVVLTAGRDVIFPTENGPLYVVRNDTAEILTLKISGQSGSPIDPGTTGFFYYDGTDMVGLENYSV